MSAKLLVRYVMLTLIASKSSLNAEPWPTTEWQPMCYEERSSECDLQDEGVAVSIQQLLEASRYYSTLGFLPPAVAADDTEGSPTKLPVYFEQKAWPSSGGDYAAGEYFAHYGLLRVSYEGFFAFNTETFGGMYTPTHELFHAIQYSYPAMADLYEAGKAGDWIIEGTAVAAESARAGNPTSGIGRPYLDYPLYDLRSDQVGVDEPGSVRHKYMSYPFWLYLADRYGGGLPDGISILHDIFTDLSEFGGRRNVIDMVDGALREVNPSGLYDIYPAFIAEYGIEQGLYSDVPRYDVLPPENAHPSHYNLQIDDTVAPVAAKPYRFRVVGNPVGGTSTPTHVEIRLEAEHPEALHLVVDETRFDAVKSGTGERNVYSTELIGQERNDAFAFDDYFVRVVNVSPDPAAYRDQDFRLIVTVYNEFLEMSGPRSASSDGGGTDAAAIDAPLPFSARSVGQFWGPMRLQLILEAGMDHPCAFQLGAITTDELATLDMMLLQNGAMSPGDYTIARPGPKEIVGQQDHAQEYAGQVVATFVLHEDHPLVGDYGMQYMGQGGVLTIETITPQWVTGHARIRGTWTRERPTSLPYDAPAAGPTDLEMELTFSIPNAAIAKRINTASCIGGRAKDVRTTTKD